MRLIDADTLLEELKKSCKWHAESSRELSLLQRNINIAKEQPTVDAVSVIKCKDCKYWETDDNETFCSDWGAYGTGAESYCSFAKRKEE